MYEVVWLSAPNFTLAQIIMQTNCHAALDADHEAEVGVDASHAFVLRL